MTAIFANLIKGTGFDGPAILIEIETFNYCKKVNHLKSTHHENKNVYSDLDTRSIHVPRS